MSKNSLSWKGRIRTAVPVREQIYSLSVLTTHPPSNIGNRNNFIRNLVRTLKYSTSHTIRELYLVCTLASLLSQTVVLRFLCSLLVVQTGFEPRGTVGFNDLLYHGKNNIFHLSYYTILLRRGRDSNPRYLAVQRFSRPPHSTTLPPLR